ncbi:MAG: NAD(P)H-dependent oxidoreductase [Syntrophales bacterium]
MKITVLNGSPKGDDSVTLQYIRYLEKTFPDHDYQIFHVAQKIRKMERDNKAFQDIMDRVAASDAVIWSFPLYYCLVCSQYKRFIELIFERNKGAAFRSKYAASLSTSVHFFDHTAHNYIHGICDDLEMKYLGGYPAEMYDLVRSRERARFVQFAGNFLKAAARQVPAAKQFPPVVTSGFAYEPGPSRPAVSAGAKKILVLVDEEREGSNLPKMIKAFQGNFMHDIETISLSSIDIKGGCLGCCRCGIDNVCQYEGKDGYIDFYNDKVKTAAIIVFAGEIRDRYLSSRWKQYFDRSFFNTHTPTLKDKQIAFLLSGPLAQLPNLQEILSAYAQFQLANLAGIVTDEGEDSFSLDELLGDLAGRLVELAGQGYVQPIDFLGVGGMKIFRDEVWGMLRVVFQSDHRYYKQHGYYDFPQRDFKTRRTNFFMMLMTKIPAFKKKFLKMIEKEMVKPLKNVVANK